MPASPMRRRYSGRRLRSGVQQQQQQQEGEEEEWCPAATFAFPESPPLLQPQRSEKMVVTKERKLRRQTMMPRQTATTVSSPTLSQRRTRRQSMMPVKLRNSPVLEPPKGRGTKAKPPALPRGESTTQTKSKRKLTEDIVTLEASPVKRRKVIPASKSATQVKTPASPPTSKKQKSLSALPVARSTRQAPKSKASPAQKAPAPSESSRRKTPGRKRALSPVAPSPGKATPSPPKRRAASRSKSESRLPRGKSLTRNQKAQKSKSAGQIKSPITKEQPASPKVKTSRKTTPKAKKVPPTPSATPPASPPPRSARRSVKKATRTSSKALPTPSRTPASGKKTPKTETPPSTEKTPTSSKKKTPSAKTPPSTKKTPTSSKKKTPTAKTPPSTKKTPTSSKKKTPTAAKTPSKKTPRKTPTSQKINKKTPVVVLKNIKSSTLTKPQNSGKKSVSIKVVSPNSASPQKRRLVRSTAKSHMTKSLKVVVSGKSPPSSMASYRKTPSSKRAPALSPPEDMGASPELPSAHKQLERIRVNIATAQERRKSASATPRKALSRTTAVTPKTKLDKVVTQADVHATTSNKVNTEATLTNHCDSTLSTPSARPPLPPTPKSSRNSNIRVCHFSSSITSSSTSVKRLRKGAAPHSSTPLKGRQALDVLDGTTLSEAMDDSLDGRGADTSLESMNGNGVGEDTTMDQTVEEPAEPEPPTQNRKSFCSLM